MRSAAVLAVLVSAVALGEEAPASVFGPGEQITYEVSFLGVPTGMAQITVGWKMEQFGREVWPIVCVGQTTNLAAAYAVKDRFVSYWDPRTQQAVGADFFVDENRKRRRERYRYDGGARKAYATKQHEGQAAEELQYDIEEGTADLAAAGFLLRNRALAVGEVHDLPIFTGVKFYKMKAKVEAKEKVATRLGEVEAWRVSVNGDFNGNLQTKRNMTLWYTADERRIPVKAEAEFLIGAIVVDAVRYEPGRATRGGAR